MLRLSPDELDRALLAIQVHGYGDFFPDLPELSLLVAKWDEIRNELAQVDLDLYEGYDVIFAFAPKSRLNVRRVALSSLRPDLLHWPCPRTARRNHFGAIAAARESGLLV